MDCINLMALGDSSQSESASTTTPGSRSNSSQMSHSSTSDSNEINFEKLNSDESNHVNANSVYQRPKEKKEDLYNKYKDGLKLLSTGQFLEAETIFQTLLNSQLLNDLPEYEEKDETPLTAQQEELFRLKYILLKNLASLNANKKQDHSASLDYFIQAVKIDATDLSVWHEMGENALKLNKYMIARYAFEQSLNINSSHWASLDNLIVLLFGLGNYSLCLKYVFHALKLDKFYINGIVFMKKIQSFNEPFYSQQIELFINSNYTSWCIDLDSYLEGLSEEIYDELMSRIDTIKCNYQKQFLKIDDEMNNNYNYVVKLTGSESQNSTSSWLNLGKFILRLSQTNKFNFQFPIKFVRETSEKTMELQTQPTDSQPKEDLNDKNTKLDDVQCSLTPSSIGNNSRGGVKRKKNSDVLLDDWKDISKRRSLRKGNEKTGSEDILISDLLRKFFNENYLNDIQSLSTPSKKKKHENTVNKYHNIISLKESEKCKIESEFVFNEISIFDLIEKYLASISFTFDQKWYEGLDETFVNIYSILNRQYNLLEAMEISNQSMDEDHFLSLCSIVLLYLEIEFSRFKETIQNRSNNKNKDLMINNKFIHILIFQLQQLDYLHENCKLERPDYVNSAYKTIPARISCLMLFASLNCPDEEISSEFYTDRLEKLLPEERTILVPNSKIFPIVNMECVKEFLKTNRKKTIIKSDEQINRLYAHEKYDIIIEQLEEFAESHKLSLSQSGDDHNDEFKSTIYVQLLNSYLKLKQFEKCAYFCRKFLRQIIAFLSEQISSLENKLQPDSDLCDFISNLLEILHQTVPKIFSNDSPANMPCLNSNSSSSEEAATKNSILHETIWLMNQLIAIFFDNEQIKFDLQFKPIRAFLIIFDSMTTNSKLEKVDFISLAHDYLARNGFCSNENGQFLIWSQNVLTDYILNCDLCKKSNGDQATNFTNNDSQEDSNAASNGQDEKCEACDRANDLLEQIFSCLFGYKMKSAARYLKNHSVKTIPITLENSVNLYHYYKPKLPEYDDKNTNRIPSEYCELLTEIVRQIVEETRQEPFEMLQEKLIADFQTENPSLLVDYFEHRANDYAIYEIETRFDDIYYLLGDFYLKTEKDTKNMSSLKYYIKDLTINHDRFDSWTGLALTQSGIVEEDYLEDSKSIFTISEFDQFLKKVYLTINLYNKSIEFIRPDDHKVFIEFGGFLYKVHSYCSRQLKIDKLLKHFQDDLVREKIEQKRFEFLNLALQIYQKGNLAIANENENANEKDKNNDLDEVTEEWLHHYMFGKIKEKLNKDLLECLEHYRHSYEYLDKHKADYLKKITYKTKSYAYSIESNEIYYRVYALTLKRVELIGLKAENNFEELKSVLEFLEKCAATRFVTSHGDFQLEEIRQFLNEHVFSKSPIVQHMKNKDVFCRCVSICIAGLHQILRRFSQHYRSLYRLAHFYAKFLDFTFYEFSKNILLSCSGWPTIAYMPCQGLFHDKNKTNFFYGVYQITNNAMIDEDLERSGSFAQHLFEIVRLLVEIFDKTEDYTNLIEMSKSFYQKIEQDRKYMIDTHREFFANYSISLAFKILSAKANRKFRTDFNDMNDLNGYQSELLPYLLDTYEVQKISSKNCQAILGQVEHLLTKLYVNLNPEVVIKSLKISIDDVVKYCQLVEKKDKMSKAKPKATKNTNNQSQPSQTSNNNANNPIVL